MSYFIFEGIIKLNQSFTLDGEEARHLLKSRRIQTGEVVEIQDKDFRRFQAQVETISKKTLDLLPTSQVTTPSESPCILNLFQALIKDKYLELILQKTTELGVASICFFQSAYSQRLKKDPEKQIQRWEKICLEACKQSGRSKPPLVTFSSSINAIQPLSEASSKEIPTLCLTTCTQSHRLSNIRLPSHEVNVVIGPEGGWKEGEFSGSCPINLGQRVLRSETAAIAVVSIIQYLHGDLHHVSV